MRQAGLSTKPSLFNEISNSKVNQQHLSLSAFMCCMRYEIPISPRSANGPYALQKVSIVECCLKTSFHKLLCWASVGALAVIELHRLKRETDEDLVLTTAAAFL